MWRVVVWFGRAVPGGGEPTCRAAAGAASRGCGGAPWRAGRRLVEETRRYWLEFSAGAQQISALRPVSVDRRESVGEFAAALKLGPNPLMVRLRQVGRVDPDGFAEAAMLTLNL